MFLLNPFTFTGKNNSLECGPLVSSISWEQQKALLIFVCLTSFASLLNMKCIFDVVPTAYLGLPTDNRNKVGIFFLHLM